MAIGSSAVGAAAVAGIAVDTAVLPPGDPGGGTPPTDFRVKVFVAGARQENRLVPGTLNIKDDIDQRSVCSFELNDETQTLHYQPSVPVSVSFDNVLLFAGTIDRVEEYSPGDAGIFNIIQIEAVDFSQFCDRHLVTAEFDKFNQTLGDVVKSIVNTQSGDAGERLIDDLGTNPGIDRTAGVQDGPLLETIKFDYATVAEAFDDLRDLTGFIWKVDFNRVLQFRDPVTNRAPVTLDESWQDYHDLRISYNRDKYSNIQFVRGGTEKTIQQVESFTGDDERTSYLLNFPVSSIVTIKVNDVAQTFGIRGKDDGTGTEWFYQGDNDTIIHDPDTAPLTDIEVLEVTYIGLFPIIVKGAARSEISRVATIEASSGVYESIDDDESIDNQDFARQKVAALLRRFARIPPLIQFETFTTKFESGTIMGVDLAEHGLQGDFLITSVETDVLTDKDFRYRVSCIDTESTSNWVDFFQKIAKFGRPFRLNENEALLFLRTLQSDVRVSDSFSTTRAKIDWRRDRRYGVVNNAQVGSLRSSAVRVATTDGTALGPTNKCVSISSGSAAGTFSIGDIISFEDVGSKQQYTINFITNRGGRLFCFEPGQDVALPARPISIIRHTTDILGSLVGTPPEI
jgi:hypothetical protein